MSKEFKYKARFSNAVTLLEEEQLEKCISKASLESLKNATIPESLDLDNNYDILGTIFNAAVVNQINRNGDGIDSSTAMSIAKHFTHKPQNLEHKRNRIVGCNVGYAWSDVETNEILTDEDVAERNDAYNLVLVGAVWKAIDPKFASMLIEASDPNSEKYMSISTSWEIGFDKFVILKGADVVSEGTIIEDKKEIERLSPHLKCNKGSGFDPEDGEPIGRLIIGDIGEVVPYGIGYTTNPAARVKGVAILNDYDFEEDLEDADAQELEDFQKNLSAVAKNALKSIKNYSTKEKLTVTKNIDKTFTMKKPKSIEELVGLLPEESQASAAEFIAQQIKSKSEEYQKEIEEKENLLKNANARSEKLEQDVQSMKETLDEMKAQSQAKEAEMKFNERMDALDNEFELSEADLKIVASDIRGLNDEDYGQWYERFSTLANSKKKEVIAQREKDYQKKIDDAIAAKVEELAKKKEDAPEKKDAKASAEGDVAEEKLDKIDEEKGQTVANATGADEKDSAKRLSESFIASLSINGKKLTK